MIDILPVIWLLILYDFVIAPFSGPFPIMAAALAAISVLGFVKLLHAIIATENHLQYYSADEFHHYVVSLWEGTMTKTTLLKAILYLMWPI